MTVDFSFSDADVVATCQCGARCFGDAPVDTFKSWWKHKAEQHPETD